MKQAAEKRLGRPLKNKDKKLPFSIAAMMITALSLTLAIYLFSNDLPKSIQNTSQQSSSNDLLSYFMFSNMIAFYLSFTRLKFSQVKIIINLLSFFILFLLQRNLQPETTALLALINILIFMMSFEIFYLRSFFGSIAFSFLLSVCFPTAFYLLDNQYLTINFLRSLLPLFAVCLFFMVPIFVPTGKAESFLGFLFGCVLIFVLIYTKGLSLTNFLNIALIIINWVVFINLRLRQRFHLPIFSLMMLFSVILLVL